jgi:hypothetical protein
MRWSYSASRSFRQCQRQWFFKNIVSSARARDPLRRRAYLLSKLQSVSAWRGKIVDEAISKVIIPALNRRAPVTLRAVKDHARKLFDRQLAFARRHPINDPHLQISDEGEDFALFHGIEYGTPPSSDELDRAWSEIELALHHLYSMDEMRAAMKTADYIIAQRALQYELMDGVTVLAYPDAIAFRPERPPLIIDWKVHAFGQNDASLQLAIYAIALSRSKHNDFPSGFSAPADGIVLLEAQLLTDAVREHRLAEDQIEEAEEYMIASAYEIACLTEGKKYSELNVDDFQAARSAETCERCAFRGICWEKSNVH